LTGLYQYNSLRSLWTETKKKLFDEFEEKRKEENEDFSGKKGQNKNDL